MKNARIMLSAIVVLSIVGGALAFKEKASHVLFLPNDPMHNPATNCTHEVTGLITSLLGPSYIGLYNTTASANCLYGLFTAAAN
jgi:hypothetical protein